MEITTDESSTATENIVVRDEELQTHLYDTTDNETEMEPVEVHNIRTQTPYAEFDSVHVQTDPWRPTRSPSPQTPVVEDEEVEGIRGVCLHNFLIKGACLGPSRRHAC